MKCLNQYAKLWKGSSITYLPPYLFKNGYFLIKSCTGFAIYKITDNYYGKKIYPKNYNGFAKYYSFEEGHIIGDQYSIYEMTEVEVFAEIL